MTELDLIFQWERDTTNTRRFKELAGSAPAVGTLYVQQWAAKELGGGELPERVRVVITVLEEEQG